MKHVAVLDADGCYRGVEKVGDAQAAGRVEVPRNIDLPPDGSYKWTGDHFAPLGYEFAKPAVPPVAPDYALFLFMRSVLQGQPMPREVGQYLDWYERTLLPQIEDKILGDKRRAGGGR